LNVAGFLARRLLIMIPTLWVIATLTFFLIRTAPGGPFQAERDITGRLAAADRDAGALYALGMTLLVVQLAMQLSARVNGVVKNRARPLNSAIARKAAS